MVLCAGALLTSCGEKVDLGVTTVEFAEAVHKAGFGGGYVYVPIQITADNEADMNESQVQVKVAVVEDYQPANGVYAGVADTTGESGDYRITSLDMVFPAYSNYYDKDAPEKYYDTTLQKWVKTVGVEVKILNTEVEVMEFKLAIESSNTTVGTQTECVVRLEKSATDRLCGDYTATPSGQGPFGFTDGALNVSVTWNSSYGCFEIAPFGAWTYSPVYAYWDEENEQMYMQPYEPLMWYSSSAMQMCYQMFFGVEGNSLKLPSESVIVLETDMANGTIKFPEQYYFGVLVFTCDESYNPGSLVGYFTACDKGYVLTKK